jgi:hypothetical protein
MVEENKKLVPLSNLRQASPRYASPLALQTHVIDRRVYKNNTISLDGYTFSNCVFIDCQLTTSKANFRLKDCHVQNCQLFFGGNALRAVKISSILVGHWMHLPEGLRAGQEPDGGITVE